jgi:7,8-dihydroneopterin aldolase/epimerase/oxygenase
MSDQITITGIHGYGHHGLFENERSNGQDFYVDLILNLDLSQAAQSDAIEDTVNYAEITELTHREITTDPVNLIEKLAYRIAERILSSHPKVKAITVTVHKPQAPVGLKVQDISVVVNKTR